MEGPYKNVTRNDNKTIPYSESFIEQFGEKNRHLAFKNKNASQTGQAAWFVSNCGSQSGREEFVEKLKRFGQIQTAFSCDF